MSAAAFRGQLQQQASLAGYTSWHVGGAAERLYKPVDVDDLAIFLQTLPSTEEIIWLGLGSNTLVRDGGIAGTVIVTAGLLKGLTRQDSGLVWAEAGVACGKLAKFSARQNLTGGEFLAGIPGTVGGALAMNAGCYGNETWDWVEQVEVLTLQGERITRTARDYKIAYRSVQGPEREWFVAATFRFDDATDDQSLKRIRELLRKRAESQPIGTFNGGSVFRNPPNDYAARLIEQAGLKGFRLGGAQVSEKHANFIINSNGASAADIENLIHTVAEKVEAVHGVKLIPEVRILGQM